MTVFIRVCTNHKDRKSTKKIKIFVLHVHQPKVEIKETSDQIRSMDKYKICFNAQAMEKTALTEKLSWIKEQAMEKTALTEI